MKKLIFTILFCIGLSIAGFSGQWNKEKIIGNFTDKALFYMSDTLMDVNGDGTEDLVMNLFVSANFLFHIQAVFPCSVNDSLYYPFFNPEYSPCEKTVHCVYGNPEGNYMILEKYRWNGNLIDTLEQYIVYGKNAVSDGFYMNYTPIYKNEIPDDYLTTKGFGYFFQMLQIEDD